MSLFVIADLHLPLAVEKPMDIFDGWDNYVEQIEQNWKNKISPEDTVVLPGDISWAMTLEQSYNDMKFIHELPGTKIIGKGNHDYWWNTVSKMERFFDEKGLTSLKILHNNHYAWGKVGICGSRGWINENGEAADMKVLLREAQRLDVSITAAEKEGLKPVVFLHYPPVFAGSVNEPMLEVLQRHKIEWCFYGHLHGRKAHKNAFVGKRGDINYRLVSADFLKFDPMDITEIVQSDNL